MNYNIYFLEIKLDINFSGLSTYRSQILIIFQFIGTLVYFKVAIKYFLCKFI